jgi:hypothetical protein
MEASTLSICSGEKFERASVNDRGASVQIQAGIGMRHCKHCFLNCDIRWLALRENVPRDKRPVILFGRSLGPSRSQQSLVREWSFEMNAVQGLSCPLEISRFEKHGAKHQVGFVANRESAGSPAPNCPALSSCSIASCGWPVLQKRDAEVISNKPREARIGSRLREDPDGIAWFACRHVDVRPQEFDVVLDFLGHHTFDSRESLQRIVELPLLKVDAGEPERRPRCVPLHRQRLQAPL